MKKTIIRPTVQLGLDDAACRIVFDGALRLLDQTGMECRSAAARDFMVRQAGIRAIGERVLFDQDFVTEFAAQQRQAAPPDRADKPFALAPPWTSLNIADTRAGEIRVPNEADLARAVRLYEAMGIRGGLPPVAVGTVAPEHRDLLSTRVCLEHSESFAGPTDTHAPERLQPFVDMLAVVGRKPVVRALYVVSPMRFDAGRLDFCLRYRDDPRFEISYCVSGMPCVGSTTVPVFPAAVSQTVAEGLAGSIFAWLCSGRRLDAGFRLDPFDFRFGNYLVGDPAAILFGMVSRRLRQYVYGIRPSRVSLLTMAKWPDAQAVHDHATAAYIGAMEGATVFANSGQLSHDEVFSPEIVVIDRELVASAERFVRGLSWTDGPAGADETVALVSEGVRNNAQFMDHPATLDNYRDFVPASRLFKGSNLGQWRQSGAQQLVVEAAEMVDKLVAGHPFERPADQVRELRAIYRRAAGDKQ
jgi:trimethylamine:corrinoid methyltransferase-like protein